MIPKQASHIPMHHNLPLIHFLGEVFIFVGLFMALHGLLDILKATDALAIVIGLLIVGIGCLSYLLRPAS
jgi:hypothetical protein